MLGYLCIFAYVSMNNIIRQMHTDVYACACADVYVSVILYLYECVLQLCVYPVLY